jgi:segregation and condensation protein B
VVASLREERGERPLTEQALETLAVVALRQPVTTEEVTAIRGAESYGTIETLRRHKYIAKAEQRGAQGRAARWRTTQLFLDRFGLATLEELYREGRLEAVFGASVRG